MAVAVIESQEATRPVPSPRCPTCQVEMHYKDMKENTIESRAGQLTLNRGYYYCETCRTGLFPLDHQLQVWDMHWSEQVAKFAVWLSGLMESKEAERVLNRVGRCPCRIVASGGGRRSGGRVSRRSRRRNGRRPRPRLGGVV